MKRWGMRGWTAALLLLVGAMVAEALPTDDQNDAVWTGALLPESWTTGISVKGS